jgi:hypothetical protein
MTDPLQGAKRDAKTVLERMRSAGTTAKRQYEDMQGFPGSGYASRLGILLLEGAEALAAAQALVEALEKRLSEATRLLDAAGRMDGWKEEVERFLTPQEVPDD